MARLWIARDSGEAVRGENHVYLFWREPVDDGGVFRPQSGQEDFMMLPPDMFTDLTYEDSPREVNLL